MDATGNIAEPFVCEGSFNAEIYYEHCMKRYLIPFIRKHCKNVEIIFWPNTASSHYTKNVTYYLKSENNEFIEICKYAPNVPQAERIK